MESRIREFRELVGLWLLALGVLGGIPLGA
jgi:hypothetical protein